MLKSNENKVNTETEKKDSKCLEIIKKMDFLSLVKVKHDGIYSNGKTEYAPVSAIVVSIIIIFGLVLYGAG